METGTAPGADPAALSTLQGDGPATDPRYAPGKADGGVHDPPAMVHELRSDVPAAGEGSDTGESGDDPAWAYLRADADAQGVSWEEYCRRYGLVSRKKLGIIRRYEVPLDG